MVNESSANQESQESQESQRVYILVHADNFAISKSRIRSDHNRLKQTIRAQLRRNIMEQVPILYTELDCGEPPLPDYLADFDEHIKRIPNEHAGNLEAQLQALKRALLKQVNRRHYVFAGGWRDACLRYTVNQVGSRRPRLVVTEQELGTPQTAHLKVPGYRERPITVAVDWRNVF